MDEMMSDNDLKAIEQALEPIVSAVKAMYERMSALEQRLSANEKLVMEELIDPIENLYNIKKRAFGISSLSEKYGSLVGPFKDFYAELTDGEDLYEKLYDELEEFRSSADGIDDAAIDTKMRELADALKMKLEKMSVFKKEEEAPVVAEVVVEDKKEEKEDPYAKLKAMKARLGDRDMY